MPETSCDIDAIVEYRLDKWFMDRLPWGMWAAVLGLAIVLHGRSSGAGGAALALVYIAALSVAFLGWAATQVIDRSRPGFWLSLAAFLVITMIAAAAISLLVGSTGRNPGVSGRLWWGMLVDPPLDVFGWMAMYLGGAWIAYALLQHVRPPRPLLRLSPRGLSYSRPWLKDVFIPWSAVRGVGPVVAENAHGPPSVFPKAIAVSVEQDFYGQEIAPRRSVWAPPGAEMMFRAKGPLMQMVLTSPDLLVSPDALRFPLEARWKLYGTQAETAFSPASTTAPPIIYGCWSMDGSVFQSMMLLAPLVGLAILVLTAFR